MRRVLMVCTGNHCRSPMAERLARHLAASRGLDWQVRSAGTHGLVGSPAAAHAVQVMAELGIALEDFRGVELSTADLQWADVVVGMEEHHAAFARQLLPDAAGKVRLLDRAGVPDPMGGTLEDYRRVRDQLAALLHQAAAAGGP